MAGEGDRGIEDIVRRLDELLRAMSELPSSLSVEPVEKEMLEAARRCYRARRERERIFGSGSCADPGWDILLGLFIAGCEGRRVDLDSACADAGVPPGTATRWIAHLVEAGLVRRSGEPGSQGYDLALTDTAQAKIREYFSRTLVERGAVAE